MFQCGRLASDRHTYRRRCCRYLLNTDDRHHQLEATKTTSHHRSYKMFPYFTSLHPRETVGCWTLCYVTGWVYPTSLHSLIYNDLLKGLFGSASSSVDPVEQSSVRTALHQGSAWKGCSPQWLNYRWSKYKMDWLKAGEKKHIHQCSLNYSVNQTPTY